MAALKTVFFCGIGGSGMSALAQVLRHQGLAVRGSDRRRDHGQGATLFERLRAQGIALFPQDGSGVDDSVDELIVSAAVEEHIPDVRGP
ncbi:MAG: Mur ligase domain-containing protein [Gemmatimonadota bacterium]|nr:Mur ligase domain-containing protein [Gemmatimonadota bacterium]